MGRRELRLVRDYVEAGYALRLLREPAGASWAGGDPADLLQDLYDTRQALAERLIALGARLGPPNEDIPPGGDYDEALLAEIEGGIERGGRYALLFSDSGTSFEVVRIATDNEPRELQLADVIDGALVTRPFAYTLWVSDERLVPSYPTWRREQLDPGGSVTQPARFGRERLLLDLAALRALVRERYLPELTTLETRASRAAELNAYEQALSSEPEPGAAAGLLLELCRDALRWRSLGPLWSGLGSLPAAERQQKLIEDLARRTEVRAACSMREARRAGAGSTTSLLRRAALAAILSGDPLGETAEQVALARLAFTRPELKDDPPVVAARQTIGGLIEALPETPPASDAARFHALAQASPNALRQAATKVWLDLQ